MANTKASDLKPLAPKVLAVESAPHIFAEGVSQVFMGVPNTKVLLHTLVEPGSEEKQEVRRAIGWVVMPTSTWLEVAQLILNQAVHARDQMGAFADSNAESFKSGLAKLSFQTGFAREDSVDVQ